MELGDYLRILHKRWRVMAVCVLELVLLAAGLTALIPESYTARTRVFISSTAGGNARDLAESATFIEGQMQSYAEVIRSELVLQPVIEELDLDMTPRTLARKVSTSVPVDTVLVDIRVTDPVPEEAARIANAVANEFQEVATKLGPDAADQAATQVTVLTPAVPPVAPTSPSWRINIALGLFVGVVVGLAAVAIRETLDSKVKGPRDVQKLTAAPIVGRISFDGGAASHPLTLQDDPRSRRAESIRQLRTNLQFLAASSGRNVFVITSSVPREGKSTVAANLAIAMAQAGMGVCLVEGDLRRPSLRGYLGLDDSVGLTSVLVGEVNLIDAVQPWGTRMDALLCGRIPPNPSELLSSQGMQAVIAELESMYDVVIIDCPPLLPVTDGAVLAKLLGGVIVVIGASIVRRQQLEAALNTLQTVGAQVQGVILNRLPTRGPDAADTEEMYEMSSSGGEVSNWIDPPVDGLPVHKRTSGSVVAREKWQARHIGRKQGGAEG